MAALPLKIISTQYANAVKKPGMWHESDTGYWTFMRKDGSFLLSHYGTIIFDYDQNMGTYAVGGTANSDRDAINSMLMILGIDDRASNAGGDMTLRNDRKQNAIKPIKNAKPKSTSTKRTTASRARPTAGRH